MIVKWLIKDPKNMIWQIVLTSYLTILYDTLDERLQGQKEDDNEVPSKSTITLRLKRSTLYEAYLRGASKRKQEP